LEKEELKKDKKKMLAELKHIKRKKKNKIVRFYSKIKTFCFLKLFPF